jgi:probable ATP-dependent RNA helicase DDX4
LFSATFPEDIQRLAGKFLHNYLFLAVGIVGGACSDVEQRFHLVTKSEKRPKLKSLISQGGW